MGDEDLERTLAAPGTNVPAQLLLNRVVGGHYLLLSLIGRGGMGVVYRAHHQVINLDFALKTLAPEQVNESNWQRFQSEGRAIARLEHRNIVKIYDMGVEGGLIPYYVMDLLEGESLADLIARKGPLSPEYAVEIFLQICSGLHCAHQAGLIHRDVKPSNIILVDNGLVKIVDFGLVKLAGAAGGANQSQTATGEIFGSPLYMSPEQCLGEKVDLRSDIYSLGCTLFEALTGKPPFKGETAMNTVMMHQTKVPPRLSEAAQAKYGGLFSVELERLVATMLSKRPVDRQSSMEEVTLGLSRFAEGKTVKPQAVFKDGPIYDLEKQKDDTRAKMLMAGLGAVVLALCAGLAIFFPLSGQKSTAVEKQISDTAPAVHKVTADEKEAQAVFAASGPIMRPVEIKAGKLVRVLHFPSVAIGTVIWDGKDSDGLYRQHDATARGIVTVPAAVKLRLKIMPPLGTYTLLYPSVLRLFGPGDVKVLALESGDTSFDLDNAEGAVELKVISPEVFKAILDWTDIYEIKIHNFTIDAEAFKAMARLRSVKCLKLDSDRFDMVEFLKLPWLDKVEHLDLRRSRQIDRVLFKLVEVGKRGLMLHIEDTEPSLEGLEALVKCYPSVLVIDGSGIDAKKLGVIGRMVNLAELSLNDSRDLAPGDLAQLSNLKKLTKLYIKNTRVSEQDKASLVRAIPGLQINDR